MSITMEALCDTLKRGNEIEFQYNDKKYSIFPNWINEEINGYYIGEMYGEYHIIDLSHLWDYKFGDELFSDILDQLVILDSTIPL